MPKSKRARVVHTSSVQKKPSKEKSATLFTNLQDAASTYPYLFIFSVANMRNTYLKTVRQTFASDGRLFFGKTKVMAKALGSNAADELAPGLGRLSRFLVGSVGVLATRREPEDVLGYFGEYAEVDFARAGSVAARTVVVPAGVVYSRGGEVDAGDDVPLAHSMEVTVRKCGMPTRLDKGKVVLDQEYVVCREGKELNSQQTTLLKLFGIAMAEFKVDILAYWSAATQEVTEVKEPVEGGMDDESD